MRYKVYKTDNSILGVFDTAAAANEYDAEKNAYKKFNNGDYESEKIVYGEEETHEIIEECEE